ncbi:MAG: phosphatidylglycerophosphatase A [Candidatus Rokubacteria bacterium]|nr:phosphatidylglycerophosphatase A [Candidatus Rokubacteria bacterium]
MALAVATVGGVGYAPVAPGTAGSLLTALFLWLVPFSRPALILFFLAVTLAGLWASGRAEQALGGKDPGPIVIDEVAGMTLTVLAVPLTPAALGAGLVLFRLFDIAKPPPARAVERLSGGSGVMADDLVAGLYALVVLGLGHALLT